MVNEFSTKITQDDLEKAGIEIIKPVDIGDLDDVVEQKTLIPPTRGVKLRIKKVKPVESKDQKWLGMNVALVLEDGVVIEEGGEPKYKGMAVYQTVTYYADPEKYTKNYFKTKQHLVDLKNLMKATTLSDPTTINDKTFEELVGQVVIGNIVQVAETRKNEDGDKEKTGVMINEVKNIKPVDITSGV